MKLAAPSPNLLGHFAPPAAPRWHHARLKPSTLSPYYINPPTPAAAPNLEPELAIALLEQTHHALAIQSPQNQQEPAEPTEPTELTESRRTHKAFS